MAIGAGRRLETSEASDAYFVIASNGAHVRLSAEASRLLDAIRSGVSFTELVTALNARPNRPTVTVDELRAAATRTVEFIERVAESPLNAPAGFWATRALLPGGLVTAVANRLLWMYTWPVALFVVTLVAWTTVTAEAGWFSLARSGDAVTVGYMIFLGSLVVHEFGHATACRRFGLKPGEIGFTMYLMFPALYSDVTASWALARRQRVVVDLGGNYFQAVVGAACLVVFGLTEWPAAAVGASLIVLGMLFSLNPVFKCDGYWVVTDSLGVTNLSKQPAAMWRSFLGWLREGRPVRLARPPLIAGLLIVYSLLSFGVWLGFVARVAPVFLSRLSGIGGEFVGVVNAGYTQGADLWSRLVELMSSVLLLAAGSVMMMQVCRALVPRSAAERLRAAVNRGIAVCARARAWW